MFEPPLRGLGITSRFVQKGRVRFPISDNWAFVLSSYNWRCYNTGNVVEVDVFDTVSELGKNRLKGAFLGNHCPPQKTAGIDLLYDVRISAVIFHLVRMHASGSRIDEISIAKATLALLLFLFSWVVLIAI